LVVIVVTLRERSTVTDPEAAAAPGCPGLLMNDPSPLCPPSPPRL